MRLQPFLNESVYVFAQTENFHDLAVSCIGMFREEEGVTVILREEDARTAGLTYTFRASWITLTAETALEQLGVTAAFSNALNNAGISCNVIAANRHDHIFVPVERAAEAVKIIAQLDI